MIISHEHKFIFIKTNKTAGTSFEIALSRFCGPDDVITPISAQDEVMRKELGYRGPQNFLTPRSEYKLQDWMWLLLKGSRKKKYYNHISAREIMEQLNPEMWESYYKFCFTRNPWDRLISMYWWLYKSEPRPSVSEFLATGDFQKAIRRGFELYTIEGQVVVDKIYRFEKIAEAAEEVRTQLGLPEKLVLPRAKSKTRKDSRSYRDVLNEPERARIAELFYDEINLLGYEF